MLKVLYSILMCFFISLTFGEEIGSAAKIINPNEYYIELIQELFYEVEKRQWCNFKMIDLTQTLNDITHTNILLTGQVRYTNGFLVSIQEIEVTDMDHIMTTVTQGNVTVTSAHFRGRVNFRHARIGYDVVVKLDNDDREHSYTGIFPHTIIECRFDLTKNMNTNEFSVFSDLVTLTGGSGVRMIFLPDDEISQVLSMRFAASNNWGGVRSWITNIMAPMIVDIATNKVEFPEICFNC